MYLLRSQKDDVFMSERKLSEMKSTMSAVIGQFRKKKPSLNSWMHTLAQPSTKESLRDWVQDFSNNSICVFFSMEPKYSALFSNCSSVHAQTSPSVAPNTTSRYDSWKMSSSLQLTGKIPLWAPTLRVWEGIPQWACEWLASAEVISESFPTCSTSGRPRPLQPELLFIN